MRMPRVRFTWLRFLVAAALVLPLGFLAFLLSIAVYLVMAPGLDATFDPNQSVHTGDEAKSRILKWAHSAVRLGEDGGSLPASARGFWLYDGGTFNGSITYWVFECDSREDCLKAVEYLGGLRRDEFKPWAPSRYAVVMEGLDFYSKEAISRAVPLRSSPWDVRAIEDGVAYEQVHEDRWLNYYAIDFDTNRVYYHHESGGFPTDLYRPRAPGGGPPARSR